MKPFTLHIGTYLKFALRIGRVSPARRVTGVQTYREEATRVAFTAFKFCVKISDSDPLTVSKTFVSLLSIIALHCNLFSRTNVIK